MGGAVGGTHGVTFKRDGAGWCNRIVFSSFKRASVRRYSSKQKLIFTIFIAPQCLSVRKQSKKLISLETRTLNCKGAGQPPGYFFPFCQRTKWLRTWRHLISCKKSLWKVKVARVAKVKNLWLSGSSACRAGEMVITELSLCPVSLLIKGWADNSSPASSHPEKRR